MTSDSNRSGRAEPYQEGLTPEERQAVLETVADRRHSKKRDGTADLLAKIAGFDPDDRAVAEALHLLVTQEASQLKPRTWYGMPAYALDGKVLVFLQPSKKFSTRYSTIGFSDAATLDDGSIWPTSFAVTGWDDEVAARVSALLHLALR
jgi:uncharacterized protein YdhG (YjbR/CyaY superfamily)